MKYHDFSKKMHFFQISNLNSRPPYGFRGLKFFFSTFCLICERFLMVSRKKKFWVSQLTWNGPYIYIYMGHSTSTKTKKKNFSSKLWESIGLREKMTRYFFQIFWPISVAPPFLNFPVKNIIMDSMLNSTSNPDKISIDFTLNPRWSSLNLYWYQCWIRVENATLNLLGFNKDSALIRYCVIMW